MISSCLPRCIFPMQLNINIREKIHVKPKYKIVPIFPLFEHVSLTPSQAINDNEKIFYFKRCLTQLHILFSV